MKRFKDNPTKDNPKQKAKTALKNIQIKRNSLNKICSGISDIYEDKNTYSCSAF